MYNSPKPIFFPLHDKTIQPLVIHLDIPRLVAANGDTRLLKCPLLTHVSTGTRLNSSGICMKKQQDNRKNIMNNKPIDS
jgi:hypothetical protein